MDIENLAIYDSPSMGEEYCGSAEDGRFECWSFATVQAADVDQTANHSPSLHTGSLIPC